MKANATQKHVFLRACEQGFVKEAVDDAQRSTYSAHNLRRVCEGPCCTEACILRTIEQGFVKQALDDAQKTMLVDLVLNLAQPRLNIGSGET